MPKYLSAKKLGLLEPQRAAAIWLLGALKKKKLPGRMRMARWLDIDPLCGTVACIGGWIDWKCGVLNPASHKTVDRRANWQLGPKAVELGKLFYPGHYGEWRPKDIIRALESFLTTGKANWVLPK